MGWRYGWTTGAVIPGATVQVQNVETGPPRNAASDAEFFNLFNHANCSQRFGSAGGDAGEIVSTGSG